MTAAPTAFPVVENGYSPQIVDKFVAVLADRARAHIGGLERRLADLERELDHERQRPAALERRLADRDAELAEERARAAVLERRIADLQSEVEKLQEVEVVEIVDVVEFEAIEVETVAEPAPQVDAPQVDASHPVDWAQAVIERPLYEHWSQEQREKAAQALRNKRLSACTPTK